MVFTTTSTKIKGVFDW